MYNRPMTSTTRGLVLGILVSLAAGGCASRPVGDDLKVVDVRTGWYDLGLVEGQNKLVPSVSFKLQNVSQEGIRNVQLMAVFRRVGESESWGDHFVQAIGRDELAGGASTAAFVLRSPRGYTGVQARLEMLAHKDFVDAKVDVLAKHASPAWVKIGEFQVERHLLAE